MSNDDEIIRTLRGIADAYEEVGVDRLQRGTMREAANVIERLQAQLAKSQRRELAAVESWRGFCVKCTWNGKQHLSDGKMDDRCVTCRANEKCNWQWRDPQETESAKEISGQIRLWDRENKPCAI